jgi:hypothetical protein
VVAEETVGENVTDRLTDNEEVNIGFVKTLIPPYGMPK